MRRLLVLTLALAVAACGDDSAGPNGGSTQLVVGALLALTGPGQTLGRTSEAALQIAADDLNARFSAADSPIRVSVRVEDTGLDPSVALEKLKALAADGVRIFIGPQSSSEVAALEPIADTAGVVLFSQGSTASSLSIADDNVFRLVPDDSEEGQAMITLLAEDGIQTVVPLWRDDAGNQGLHDAVAGLFPVVGGTVTGGVKYAPGTTDFTAQLQTIRSEVQKALTQNGSAGVAVYLAAFEESAVIFAQASADPVLSQVRWYGGDGTVQSAAVVADPIAASFAATTEFTAPTYGLDDPLLQQDATLIGAIQSSTGLAPDAFTLAAYDALHIAALAYAEVGLDSLPNYRAAVLGQAAAYTGATGSTTLNANGDRAVGDYDFYRVCGGQTPAWLRVAAYRAAQGTIVDVGGC